MKHGLEENGEVVLGHQNGTEKEEQVTRSRPHNALFDHRERHHGTVTLAIFPDQEDDKGHSRANQKADYNGAIPRVHGTAVLQCKQKHDGSGANEHKAWKIQRLNGRAEDLSGR